MRDDRPDLTRRRWLVAPLLLSPLALAAGAGASARTDSAPLPGRREPAAGAADRSVDARLAEAHSDRPTDGPAGPSPPRLLPAGLTEGAQRPWALPDAGNAYGRMQMAIPAGYAASRKPWPLLVFLHGAGERGLDVDDVKRGGPPLQLDRGIAYPMIACSPQTDPDTRWQPQRLHALLAGLSAHLAVDPTRVLATGLSLGGSGVWRWACEFPDDLAAIAPICGYADPAAVAAMRRVPVRAYHGELDPLVPLARQQACVAELQRQGGTASLTVYPGVGHDAWTAAYEDPGLLPWLLAQRRP